MLLKHSFFYVLARGLPGVVNFAALALYTRVLVPQEYGRYALLLVSVGFINVMMFQWLRLVVGRFLQGQSKPRVFLSGILAQFYLLIAISTAIGITISLLCQNPVWQQLVFMAVLLLVCQGALELTLAVASAKLDPKNYGFLLGSKALISLFFGMVGVWFEFGTVAPILGLIIGQSLAVVLFGRNIWQDVKPCWPSINECRQQLEYGLPLIATFLLMWIITGSDRLLLAWLVNEEAVAYYSVGYDLVFQSLTLLLSIISTAAYPLVVKALEQHGETQAAKQLVLNGELIVAVSLAGAIGLMLLSPSIFELFIGQAYSVKSSSIFPIVVVASVLAGIKAYHFDVAFHLGKCSYSLVWIAALAATINIVFNLVLIPLLGTAGAAWSTLCAYAIAFFVSMVLGRKVFPMPSVLPIALKGIFIAIVVFFAVEVSIFELKGVWVLLVGTIAVVLSAFIAMLVLNISGGRNGLLQYFDAYINVRKK